MHELYKTKGSVKQHVTTDEEDKTDTDISIIKLRSMSDQKQFTCNICYKQFEELAALTQHELIHDDPLADTSIPPELMPLVCINDDTASCELNQGMENKNY
ncbi:hypothetical protein MSG28_002646 [Choristoneura fumiferana]|uniref:Uncharacterized protein n=1 Tax=Choristoneura fumiferana TaxID=7141 RepID=A0ACC0JIT9_CHOFU|nr:hypothetical protein MSG28_002646 [Choristoneura fumiferana]